MTALVPTSEAHLQSAVLDLAKVFGWTRAHFRAARTAHGWATPVAGDGAGFPDLVLVHPEQGVIFAELKSDKGKLSLEQEAWRDVLLAAGAQWRLWRPADWSAITAELSGGRAS